MKRTSIRRALVPGIAVWPSALTGLRRRQRERRRQRATAPRGGACPATLAGGGASSQEKAQAAWRAGFQTDNPDVTVNYDPVGSGDRPRELHQRAPSRSPAPTPTLNDDEGELDRRQGALRRQDVDRGPGLRQPDRGHLQRRGRRRAQPRPPTTVAGIFDGKITTWNDPAIADEQPRRRRCPTTAITAGAPLRTTRAPPTTSPTTSTRPATAPGPTSADGVWPIDIGRRGRRGHLRRGRRGRRAATARSATPTPARPATSASSTIKVGEEFVAPSAEGAAKVVAISPARRGPRGRRHGLRPRPRPPPRRAPTRSCWCPT